MGLSRSPKSDKVDLTTYQVLLDIFVAVSNLLEDKKALKKAADEAYALGAEAEAKAKSAYDDINKAEAAKKEAIAQQQIAQEMTATAEKTRDDVARLVESTSKERKRLQDQDAILGSRALDLNNKEIDLIDRESKLVASQDELNKGQEALVRKRTELNEFEAELKDKAEKLRSIMGA